MARGPRLADDKRKRRLGRGDETGPRMGPGTATVVEVVVEEVVLVLVLVVGTGEEFWVRTDQGRDSGPDWAGSGRSFPSRRRSGLRTFRPRSDSTTFGSARKAYAI